jgi:tetratricopeptide (TPR) repeat protein
VTALAVSLTAEEQTEYDSTKTESPAAYDAFLRGWELYRRGTAEDFAAAIPFLEKAIKLDPNYGQAYAALAAVYWSSASNGWNKPLGLDINQTRNQARIHLRSAMKSPTALAFRVASERAAHYRRKADEAIEYAESAIALDANNPAGHLAMANALIKAGKPSDAVDSMHMAMRLDPHFPVAYLSRLGRAQFAMEEFHDAAATFERAADRDPNNDWTFVYLAAAYGHLNRAQQAKSAVQEANALRANMGWSALTLESLNIGRGGLATARPLRPERNLLREGLTKAGVKTGSEWTHLVTTTPTGQFEVEGATMIDVSTAKALHDRKVPFVDTRGLIALGRISRTHKGLSRCPRFHWHEAGCRRIIRRHA